MTVGSYDVLLVDTRNRVKQNVRQRLKDGGYETHIIAAKGKSLSYIRHRIPDLVLVSLPGPIEKVLGFVKQVRAITLKTPIIVLLKPDEVGDAVPLLEQGATDYVLLLPGAEDLLLHVLGKHLEYRGLDRRVNRDKNITNTLEEKLRLLVSDQQAGFRVQRSMMPASPSHIGDVLLDHQIYPSLILSGDFIDYFPLPENRVLFYLADVAGHGASSAFVTVLLRSLSRRLEREYASLGLISPGEILTWMNDELLLCEVEHHVTIFMGVADMQTGQLTYSNAGHFPAAILSSDEHTAFLKSGGRPIGLFDGIEYESITLTLPETWSLVLFSDGVFEIMAQQTLKDKEDHLLSLVKCGARNVEQLSEQLGMTEAGSPPDDIAVFTVGVG